MVLSYLAVQNVPQAMQVMPQICHTRVRQSSYPAGHFLVTPVLRLTGIQVTVESQGTAGMQVFESPLVDR